jgi:hypothetical protein
MSPVMDNFEGHDFEAVQWSPHPNFLKIKTWRVNKGLLCDHNYVHLVESCVYIIN